MPTKDEEQLPISTSTPPEVHPKQESLFREVLILLNKHNVPYVVSGAFALQFHTGICRDTKDLDVFLAAEHVPAALRRLEEDGFETEIADPIWLAKARRRGFFVDLITGMSNGVLAVDQSWIDRASAGEVFGVPVKILGSAELIASKLFVTRRERFDGADIAHVIYGTKGKLDWDRLLNLVGEHWEVLLWSLILFRYVYPANSDFVPRGLWNDLLQRFQQEIENPNPNSRFRGGLIDPRMFAIDMDEWGLPDLEAEYRHNREPKLIVPPKNMAA